MEVDLELEGWVVVRSPSWQDEQHITSRQHCPHTRLHTCIFSPLQSHPVFRPWQLSIAPCPQKGVNPGLLCTTVRQQFVGFVQAHTSLPTTHLHTELVSQTINTCCPLFELSPRPLPFRPSTPVPRYLEVVRSMYWPAPYGI